VSIIRYSLERVFQKIILFRFRKHNINRMNFCVSSTLQ
jgi:hypothetical protein